MPDVWQTIQSLDQKLFQALRRENELIARVRELEAGLTLLANDENWDYADCGKVWIDRDANGQATDVQEIAQATLGSIRLPNLG